MNSYRSFISLNIDSSVQKRLKLIQDNVKVELSNQLIKWESTDKFHLTMRFLGDVEKSRLDEILKELGSLKFDFDSFKLVTCGIGFFPNQKHPNVVFIDLRDEGNYSSGLVNKIDVILDKFGFKPDKKFVPHITLGRFRRENRRRMNGKLSFNVEPIEIIFDSYYVMKSVLKPAGSVYEILQEFKFNNTGFPPSRE